MVCLFGCGTAREVRNSPREQPLDSLDTAATVPVSPDARRVARRFLETGVGRKNLAVAYTLVGRWLKGVPRKQWLTGRNPVTYYPARNLKTAPFRTVSSTKRALLLEVGPLVLRQGNTTKGLRRLSFRLEVDRIRGKWLVNYFMPYPTYNTCACFADRGGN